MKNLQKIMQWFILILFLAVIFIMPQCTPLTRPVTDEPDLVGVKITRVIDGDTAYALLPGNIEEKVRFIGVDAPEINHPTKGLEPYGPEAETFARTALEGRRVWLEFDLGQRDQYGRLLAYIWLEVPSEISDQEIRDKMFNARLLLEGYAIQVIFQPNVKYVDFFSNYEAEAKEVGKGIWGEQ